METMENNTVSSTHQEKAKKMRKLRRWQIPAFGEKTPVQGFFCVHLNFQEGVRFFDPFFDCIYDGEPFWVTTKFRYGRKPK